MKVDGANKLDANRISRDLKELLKERELSQPARKKEEDKKKKKVRERSTETEVINRYIRFEVDRELNRVIAKIVDRKTGEIVRQIPPEEVVRIAKFLHKTGLLYKGEA